MRRVKLLVLVVVAAWSVTALGQSPAGTTVFEGARVIVGDTRAPIENASFVVTGGRFVQVGTAANVKVPAGATRVSLAGKTVMPAIIDTHTHLSQTREMLLDDLRRRAYFGVGAAMSMGQDTTDVSFQVRAETLPGMARFFTAGRGITATGARAHDCTVLGDHGRRGTQGGGRERREEGRPHQDLGRRSHGHGEEAAS